MPRECGTRLFPTREKELLRNQVSIEKGVWMHGHRSGCSSGSARRVESRESVTGVIRSDLCRFEKRSMPGGRVLMVAAFGSWPSVGGAGIASPSSDVRFKGDPVRKPVNPRSVLGSVGSLS